MTEFKIRHLLSTRGISNILQMMGRRVNTCLILFGGESSPNFSAWVANRLQVHWQLNK